jgi:hypothetical protein
METGYPFRLYANPFKQMLLLVAAVGFVVGSVWMFLSSTQHGDIFRAIIGVCGALLFGLGTIAGLDLLVENVLLRRPLLEIDGLGWRYRYPLGWGSELVNWQDITLINCYSQRLSPTTTTYYLSVRVRDVSRLSHPRIRALNARLLPSMRNAAFSLQLNQVFGRCTPEKCVMLLERIASAGAHEMRLYGIQMQESVRKW